MSDGRSADCKSAASAPVVRFHLLPLIIQRSVAQFGSAPALNLFVLGPNLLLFITCEHVVDANKIGLMRLSFGVDPANKSMIGNTGLRLKTLETLPSD